MRRRTRGYVLAADQSDTGNTGMFSQRANRYTGEGRGNAGGHVHKVREGGGQQDHHGPTGNT
eukprot:840069-Pyramimonas_sp.AAC.1